MGLRWQILRLCVGKLGYFERDFGGLVGPQTWVFERCFGTEDVWTGSGLLRRRASSVLPTEKARACGEQRKRSVSSVVL
jgi:hypothetical protein